MLQIGNTKPSHVKASTILFCKTYAYAFSGEFKELTLILLMHSFSCFNQHRTGRINTLNETKEGNEKKKKIRKEINPKWTQIIATKKNSNIKQMYPRPHQEHQQEKKWTKKVLFCKWHKTDTMSTSIKWAVTAVKRRELKISHTKKEEEWNKMNPSLLFRY